MRKLGRCAFLAVGLFALTTASVYAAPPPWAPAHGHRRKPRVVVLEPVPFVYLGTTYVPLRSVTSLIGAALLWDSLDGRALITYNGREIGLLIGSPKMVYGGETLVLSAAPVIVRDVVYVPVDFCERYLAVPVEHTRTVIKFKGPAGWREYRVVSRPPGRVRGWAGRPVRSAPSAERSAKRGHAPELRARPEKMNKPRSLAPELSRPAKVRHAGKGGPKQTGGSGKQKHMERGQGRGKAEGGGGREHGSKGKHEGRGRGGH
jgi:hypothetical protein